MQKAAGVPSDGLVDAVLGASRVLVAVAARSLADAPHDVTLPQYRALVVLAGRGAQRPTDLADELGVHPSTAGRMCDRLARKGLVRRRSVPGDRRTVRVQLTDDGRALVDAVTVRRRAEISRIVRRLPAGDVTRLVGALQALCDAADEVPLATRSDEVARTAAPAEVPGAER